MLFEVTNLSEGFTTKVAHMRLQSSMDHHMLFEISRCPECLTANRTEERPVRVVYLDLLNVDRVLCE